MENKQTAVEWLVDELLDGKLLMPSLIEQAIAMEKEQIINAHIKGHYAPSSTLKYHDAEQYYNETYNQ